MTNLAERESRSIAQPPQIKPSRPLAVEMRRGYGKWLAAILVVAGAAAAASRLADHTQDWPAAVVLLSNLGLVMGPLAIGVSAFAGGRAKRRGTFWIEDTTRRGRLRAAAIEGTALALWMLVAYLIVLLICFVPTWIQATWSGPDIPRVVASAGGILAQTIIGYFLGRLVPFALTAPFLAAASFSLTAVVNSAPHSQQLGLYLPVNLNEYDVYNRTNGGASLTELAFYASCAALVIAAWALLTTTRLWTSALAAAALAALVISSIGLASYDGQSNAEGVAVAFACRGEHPVICTHPATRDAAGQLRARFRDVVDLLIRTPFAVNRAEQRPRGVGSAPTAGAVGFGLDNRSSGAIDEARLELAHNAISQRASCADHTGSPLPGTAPAAPTLIAALGDRIVYGRTDAKSHFDTNPRVNEAITYITSRTDSQLKQLLNRHANEIARCTISPVNIQSS